MRSDRVYRENWKKVLLFCFSPNLCAVYLFVRQTVKLLKNFKTDFLKNRQHTSFAGRQSTGQTSQPENLSLHGSSLCTELMITVMRQQETTSIAADLGRWGPKPAGVLMFKLICGHVVLFFFKILDDEVSADFYVAVPDILPKLVPLKNKLRKKFPKSKRGELQVKSFFYLQPCWRLRWTCPISAPFLFIYFNWLSAIVQNNPYLSYTAA